MTDGGNTVVREHHGKNRRAALVLGVTGLLGAAALSSTVAPTLAAAQETASKSGCIAHFHGSAKAHHFGAVAQRTCSPGGGDTANGTPPLLYHGGPVMGTRSTGSVVVTPIYWNPAGHPIDSAYKSIINTYLSDVAADSGTRTNVYSTLLEYSGTNGTIRYQITRAAPIEDTNPLPPSGCNLVGRDKFGIYADNSGYDSCLDDAQVISEIDSVTAGRPRDFAHIYVIFLPKHVESCFFAGSTTTASNFCTINHEPSAAYCAYHNQAPSSTIYANMPYPIYASPVGFTCSSDAVYPVVQTPNGNADADTEVSPTSHEIMEAITDPDTVTGWYDSSGFENGDECAYIFGVPQGTDGALYNQVINGHHYLTQEEFSNADFFKTGGGCLQHE